MGMFADACIAALVATIVSLTWYGMFGDHEGGNMPTDDWFGYHPALMALGMPGLMTLGRWSYFLDGGMEKAQMRKIHRAFMTCALLAVLLGYLCVFMAHKPKGQFFGYDFENAEWKEWKRVTHVWLGYTCILLSLAQAVMGFMKLESLRLGERRFTFHGTLGKVTMVLGCCAVFMAIWLWTWSSTFKAAMVALTAGCVVVALIPHEAVSGGVGADEVAPLTS